MSAASCQKGEQIPNNTMVVESPPIDMKKLTMAVCIMVNLGILAVFKYGNFAIEPVNSILNLFHISVQTLVGTYDLNIISELMQNPYYRIILSPSVLTNLTGIFPISSFIQKILPS